MEDRGGPLESLKKSLKVVLHRSPRSPDIHDLSECHHLYDLGRHNRINHELYSEPTFPAPQLYLLRHTLKEIKEDDSQYVNDEAF